MIFNMVGGAGGGKDGAATLTVQAPINTDVTVSKDTKSYMKNSGSTGIVTFQGLTTGEWAVSISNELQTQTRTVTITTTYSVVIAFFAATINITYPAGSTCTVKKDSITLTAPDTSGAWDCVVPSTGVWNVYCTDGELTVDQDVTITADGETQSLNLAYFTATIAVTYPAGSTCSTTMGDITLNAPDTSGTWTCIVHYAGNWVFTCTDGTQITTNTVTISTDGESKSLTLSYTLYLYRNGVKGVAFTSSGRLKDVTETGVRYSITWEVVWDSAFVTLKCASTISNGNGVAITTSNSLDLSAYNTLKCVVPTDCYCHLMSGCFGVSSGVAQFNTDGGITNALYKKYFSSKSISDLGGISSGTYILDISAATRGYIFMQVGGRSNNAFTELKISDIELYLS